MAFLLLYMTLAIDKLNGCGLNTAHCECLPKNIKVTQYQLQKNYVLGSTNKSEHFNYKGEWACAYIVTHLKEN